MTETAITISVKVPPKLLDRIPAPGNGRSRFILEAMEEKLFRQTAPKWTANSRRGRKLAKLLEAGRSERGPRMTMAEVEHELQERRGRNF